MKPCTLPSETAILEFVGAIRDYAFCHSDDRLPGICSFVASCSDSDTAARFMEDLPGIVDDLKTDVQAILENDPAAVNSDEIVACYPGVKVMINYRAAHKLLELGVEIVPRMITELAHSLTGIDIHPAARIGRWFAIDHGTGVVIGETAIIGEHVTIYQGVTLGARNFRYDASGRPVNIPRHPILEDNVTVYSNTSILGRVTIGHDTVIGGNIWLTHDVPPHSRILQVHAVYVREFDNGDGI